MRYFRILSMHFFEQIYWQNTWNFNIWLVLNNLLKNIQKKCRRTRRNGYCEIMACNGAIYNLINFGGNSSIILAEYTKCVLSARICFTYFRRILKKRAEGARCFVHKFGSKKPEKYPWRAHVKFWHMGNSNHLNTNMLP